MADNMRSGFFGVNLDKEKQKKAQRDEKHGRSPNPVKRDGFGLAGPISGTTSWAGSTNTTPQAAAAAMPAPGVSPPAGGVPFFVPMPMPFGALPKSAKSDGDDATKADGSKDAGTTSGTNDGVPPPTAMVLTPVPVVMQQPDGTPGQTVMVMMPMPASASQAGSGQTSPQPMVMVPGAALPGMSVPPPTGMAQVPPGGIHVPLPPPSETPPPTTTTPQPRKLRPSKQHLKKTKLCRHYNRAVGCNNGDQCPFAHGEHELTVESAPATPAPDGVSPNNAPGRRSTSRTGSPTPADNPKAATWKPTA